MERKVLKDHLIGAKKDGPSANARHQKRSTIAFSLSTGIAAFPVLACGGVLSFIDSLFFLSGFHS